MMYKSEFVKLNLALRKDKNNINNNGNIIFKKSDFISARDKVINSDYDINNSKYCEIKAAEVTYKDKKSEMFTVYVTETAENILDLISYNENSFLKLTMRDGSFAIFKKSDFISVTKSQDFENSYKVKYKDSDSFGFVIVKETSEEVLKMLLED